MPRRTRFIVAAIVILSAASARADEGDPPSAVGRLSIVDGAAAIYGPGESTWSSATVNYPLTPGSWLWNPTNARSELQFGSTLVSLGQASELGILAFDEHEVRLHLATGEASIRVGEVPDGGFRVETPGGIATLEAPGWYHLEAGPPQGEMPARSGALAVLAGRARFTGPFPSVELGPGQRADSDGDGEPPEISSAAPTPLDVWAPRAEPATAMTETLRYVSPGVTGYQDLETQGQWEDTTDYGPVWYPNVVATDWAPYRYGRWRYVAPWGWTWIDDAPWGFAPFHYGRWLRIGLRWAWTPGASDPHPVYAPALVSFFAVDADSGPRIGWVPLGPTERFRPYYRASERYRERLDRDAWKDRHHEGDRDGDRRAALAFSNAFAATSVPRMTFARGLPVQRGHRPPDPARIRDVASPQVLADLRPSGELRAPGRNAPPSAMGPTPLAAPPLERRHEDAPDVHRGRTVGNAVRSTATPPAPDYTPPRVRATPPAPTYTPPPVRATPPAATPGAWQQRPGEDGRSRPRGHEEMPAAAGAHGTRPRVFTHPNEAAPQRIRQPRPAAAGTQPRPAPSPGGPRQAERAGHGGERHGGEGHGHEDRPSP